MTCSMRIEQNLCEKKIFQHPQYFIWANGNWNSRWSGHGIVECHHQWHGFKGAETLCTHLVQTKTSYSVPIMNHTLTPNYEILFKYWTLHYSNHLTIKFSIIIFSNWTWMIQWSSPFKYFIIFAFRAWISEYIENKLNLVLHSTLALLWMLTHRHVNTILTTLNNNIFT